MRFDPKTKLSEFYAVPKDFIGVRGGDIDKNGVLWGSGSNGGLISFDESVRLLLRAVASEPGELAGQALGEGAAPVSERAVA